MPTPLPHRATFMRLLSAPLAPQAAGDLVRTAERLYPRLLAVCPANPDRPRLEKMVLPALALYRSLREDGIEPQAALGLLQPVVLETYFGRLRRGLQMFERLTRLWPVDLFQLLRPALRQMAVSTEGSPPVFEEDTPTRMVMYAHRCTIVDTLRALDAPELAPLFCASDDWLSAALPRIRWLRTTTLARGGPYCDFHWESLNNRN